MNHDSVKNLRVLLEDVLAEKLGTYTFPNGIKEKAIAVDIGGKYPPSNTKVEGLEVVIHPYAEITTTNLLNNFSGFDFAHEIHLKQWDIDPSTVLTESVVLIKALLGSSIEVGQMLAPVEEKEIIESCTLIYLDRRLIRYG